MASRGRPKPPKHFTLKPLKLVYRESTGPVAPSAALIERAKALIQSDATNGIGVADIVRRLGVSRRLLELRYREAEGTTIRKALAARRLEVARKQILTTSRTIVRIAADCGFCDAKHLTHAFTAAYGRSPRNARR